MYAPDHATTHPDQASCPQKATRCNKRLHRRQTPTASITSSPSTPPSPRRAPRRSAPCASSASRRGRGSGRPPAEMVDEATAVVTRVTAVTVQVGRHYQHSTEVLLLLLLCVATLTVGAIAGGDRCCSPPRPPSGEPPSPPRQRSSRMRSSPPAKNCGPTTCQWKCE